MKKLILILLISFIALSCKKEPYPLNDLAGYWSHDFEGYSGIGKAEQYIDFELYCNGTFGVTIKTYTDADSIDGCFMEYYTEGIMGKYKIKGNELILEGSYRVINHYNPKHCYRTSGSFNQTYKIEKLGYKTLMLKRVPKVPVDDLIAIDIPLVKTIALECDD